MAGHSKWANIKHRKARQDAKRGAAFTKIIRELTVAAKDGGPVIEDNPRLRLAYDKALSANMAKDTINRAIQRGAGGQEGQNLEEVIYEGYAPGGIAVYIKTLTDNKNRTASNIRTIFQKAGGSLGTQGAHPGTLLHRRVAWTGLLGFFVLFSFVLLNTYLYVYILYLSLIHI